MKCYKRPGLVEYVMNRFLNCLICKNSENFGKAHARNLITWKINPLKVVKGKKDKLEFRANPGLI